MPLYFGNKIKINNMWGGGGLLGNYANEYWM